MLMKTKLRRSFIHMISASKEENKTQEKKKFKIYFNKISRKKIFESKS